MTCQQLEQVSQASRHRDFTNAELSAAFKHLLQCATCRQITERHRVPVRDMAQTQARLDQYYAKVGVDKEL